MKKILSLVGVFIGVFYLSITSLAADYTFDANYYATKYPDVSSAVGNDYDSLYNHYINFGQYEGRFVSQAEESYYFESGLSKQPVPVVQDTAVENASEVKSADEEYIAPVYVPIDIIPVFNTYVDVDKTNQVVSYFEDGVMLLQGPCVTGNEKSKHGTPTGTFSITQHMTNKYLIGPTWKSYVNYWMRFSDDGCGLHDASWRSSFGGDIYKTNGSHGCVNLQKDIAKQLYDYTSVGTTVYVH